MNCTICGVEKTDFRAGAACRVNEHTRTWAAGFSTQMGASNERGGPQGTSGRQRPGDRFVVTATIRACFPGCPERRWHGDASGADLEFGHDW